MHRSRLTLGFFFAVPLGGLVLAAASDSRADQPPPPAAAIEFFEAKVRPVLVDSCLRCHGPDKQSSGLRVDSREALLQGGENGPAIAPGDADKSLLVQAIQYTHDDFRMPPKTKLPDAAIAAVADWVRQGAPWPAGKILEPAARDRAAQTHWSFRPVRAVEPPRAPAEAPTWGVSPIDAFVLAKLHEKGMVPSPQTDKRTLIRRATFDLTGLPPTAEEIAAFEADTSNDAFARVVDRLLASPRYGERWGRHWLDVARYADTKGYVFVEDRRYPFAYTYRDYVVRSFNEDLPYNQFILEQLAADRLPQGADNSSLAALGFLTVGRRFLNDGNDIIDDRIDAVTRGFLGLTVACARCHDHKYDAIPTEDYYSLYGVFASSFEPGTLPLLQGKNKTGLAQDYERQAQALEKEYRDLVAAKEVEVQSDLRSRAGIYLKAAFDLEFKADQPKLRDRAQADNLPRGRLRLSAELWNAFLARPELKNDAVFAPWHPLLAIPENELARKTPEVLQGLAAAKVAVNPLVAKALSEAPLGHRNEIAARYAALLTQVEARWRERLKAGAADSLPEPEWEALRKVLYAPEGALNFSGHAAPASLVEFEENKARLLNQEDRKKLAEIKNRLTQLTATHAGAPARAMVMNDAPQPAEPHVFIRGNPGRPGKQIPRRFLKALSSPERKPFEHGSGRLDLAQAIANPENPLTVRVLVNRVWLQHFGVGLVTTPSDFGVRSDPPSHPELLDYLSHEFVRNGWSIKSLHRMIMLTSTYQQGSDNNPSYAERDPEDRMLWKYPRRRLDFESMRDAFLMVSGQLDPTIGGRSVPIGEPPFTPRRTLYGFIDRQNLDGVYRTFDFASPDATSARRFVTTVPQQALFLMNSPFVVEQARQLTALSAASGESQDRIRALYSRIFGRTPERREIEVGLRFLAQQSQRNQPPVPTWQFGYGAYDESTRHVARFEHFAHWTGNTWQAGPALPDPQKAFLNLNAGGGHVGSDPNHAAIRRWVAPRDAKIQIEAVLQHDSPNGDGVRGRIVATRAGELGSWIAHHAKVPTQIASYEVHKGEAIDFVVDCRVNDGFDSFVWSPVIREIQPTRAEWTATNGFQGPAPQALSPWEEYTQVLLLTNEFMFVD